MMCYLPIVNFALANSWSHMDLFNKASLIVTFIKLVPDLLEIIGCCYMTKETFGVFWAWLMLTETAVEVIILTVCYWLNF